MHLRRIGALIIDLAIINSLAALLKALLPMFSKKGIFEWFGLEFTYTIGVSFILCVCYFILFDLANSGRTIGKILFKIYVAFEDGTSVPKSILIKRSLLKTLSIIIMPVAVLLFFLNDYYSLQDRFARTQTITKS